MLSQPVSPRITSGLFVLQGGIGGIQGLTASFRLAVFTKMLGICKEPYSGIQIVAGIRRDRDNDHQD